MRAARQLDESPLKIEVLGAGEEGVGDKTAGASFSLSERGGRSNRKGGLLRFEVEKLLSAL